MNTPLPQDLHQAFRVAARAVVKRQRAKIAPLAHFKMRGRPPPSPRHPAEAFPGNNETPAHSSADAQTRINRARIMTRPLKNGKHGLSKKLYARCGASSSTERFPRKASSYRLQKKSTVPDFTQGKNIFILYLRAKHAVSTKHVCVSRLPVPPNAPTASRPTDSPASKTFPQRARAFSPKKEAAQTESRRTAPFQPHADRTLHKQEPSSLFFIVCLRSSPTNP